MIRVIAITLLLIPTLAHAWGGDGHRITAAVAESMLTDKVRERVTELLGGQSMAEASTWADEIKGQKPETRPWHYLNPPESVDRVTFEHCVPEGDVLATIRDQAVILRARDSTTVQRAEALRFLIHMVGDIHTPLHVSRAHDKGGNDIRVEFQGSFTNLHSLWDSGLLRATREPWEDRAARLTENITDEQVKAWRKLDPERWATESYILAMTFAYRVPDSLVIEDDPAYKDQAISIIDERLSMGGVRLAALLNRVLANEETEVPALGEAADEASAAQFVGVWEGAWDKRWKVRFTLSAPAEDERR